eukprot:TRINITY_DN61522_c0_g1_i1.p1 TRINITY_DN61522_c0_g1~~TRINITY_DN61522_c0_g1_i1.p1  ORF type:complete len:381 (-),score=68.46 TRINITY_DN61522_c0_g1_i1:154-1296(-)
MASSLQAKLASLKQQLKADNNAAAASGSAGTVDNNDLPPAKRTKVETATGGTKGEVLGGARLGARPKAVSAPTPIREQDADSDVVAERNSGQTPPVAKQSQSPKAPNFSMSTATPAPKRTVTRTPNIGTKAPSSAAPTAKTSPVAPAGSSNMPLDKLKRLARYHCVRVDANADEADIIAALRKDGVDNKEIDTVLEIDGLTAGTINGDSMPARRTKDDGSRKGAKAACRKWKPAFAVTPFEWEKEEAKIKAKAKQLALPAPAPKMSAMSPGSATAKPAGYKPPSLSLMDKASAARPAAKPASPAGPPPTPDASTSPGGGAVGLGARPKASMPPPGWKSESPGEAGFDEPRPKTPGGKPELCWDFVAGNCAKGPWCKWPHS